MGLVNRLVPPGQARRAARRPGAALAALPQFCLRSDRMSALEQWGLTEEEAAVNEARRGRAVIDSGETLDGRRRSPEGAGPRRHCPAVTDDTGVAPRDPPRATRHDGGGLRLRRHADRAGGASSPSSSPCGGLARAARRGPVVAPPAPPRSAAGPRPTRPRRHCSPGCSAVSRQHEWTSAAPAFAERHLARHLRQDARRRLAVAPAPGAPRGHRLGLAGVLRAPAGDCSESTACWPPGSPSEGAGCSPAATRGRTAGAPRSTPAWSSTCGPSGLLSGGGGEPAGALGLRQQPGRPAAPQRRRPRRRRRAGPLGRLRTFRAWPRSPGATAVAKPNRAEPILLSRSGRPGRGDVDRCRRSPAQRCPTRGVGDPHDVAVYPRTVQATSQK